MFERYTEHARRVVFFARYEASQLGSSSIDTQHLLLGLLREGGGSLGPILKRAGVRLAAVREEVERRVVESEKVSTSVDLPLAAGAKRTLQHASEEAEALGSDHIGSEHILIGLLREPDSIAGAILIATGLGADEVRQEVRAAGRGESPSPSMVFRDLVAFLRQLEARRAPYSVALAKGEGIRVEVVLPAERWAATFFTDGHVKVEVFGSSGGDQGEGALARLLDRLGPPPGG